MCGQKKNYRPVQVVAFWWSHHKRKENDNQVSAKVSSTTLPSHLFIVIEINKKAWWLIVDTDDRSQMLTKQVNLWLLLFDYAHTALSHITPKYIAVYADHSIDYAYFLFYSLKFSFRTLCGTQIHLTLTSHPHIQIFAWLLSIVCVLCRQFFFLFFKKKKVSINIIRWESLVCVCGEDGLCLFFELFSYLS